MNILTRAKLYFLQYIKSLDTTNDDHPHLRGLLSSCIYSAAIERANEEVRTQKRSVIHVEHTKSIFNNREQRLHIMLLDTMSLLQSGTVQEN